MHLRKPKSWLAAYGSDSLRPSAGAAMGSSAAYRIGVGFLCSVLCGTLSGQVSPRSQVSGQFASVVAASTTQQQAPSSTKPHDDSFVIGNDDVLAINVWKEADLSRSTQVRSDGKITLPLIGEIQATGRTPLQLEQDITVKLRNYINRPEVTIMVEQVNSEKFNVLGQVEKPGSYSLALAPTVVDAIAIAGGTRDFAKQKGIYILRQKVGGGESRIAFNYKQFIKGNGLQQNIKLQPRDTVIVP